MSMAKQSHPGGRIRLLAIACVRFAVGPLRDGSRMDRKEIGAAGGILVLAAVGLPVAVASITSSKTVPTPVLILCAVAVIIGLALIIKSCQHPKTEATPETTVPPIQNPLPADEPSDEQRNPPDVVSSLSAIEINKAKLTKSGISIPEGSRATIASSELDESPLTISQRPQPKNESGSE